MSYKLNDTDWDAEPGGALPEASAPVNDTQHLREPQCCKDPDDDSKKMLLSPELLEDVIHILIIYADPDLEVAQKLRNLLLEKVKIPYGKGKQVNVKLLTDVVQVSGTRQLDNVYDRSVVILLLATDAFCDDDSPSRYLQGFACWIESQKKGQRVFIIHTAPENKRNYQVPMMLKHNAVTIKFWEGTEEQCYLDIQRHVNHSLGYIVKKEVELHEKRNIFCTANEKSLNKMLHYSNSVPSFRDNPEACPGGENLQETKLKKIEHRAQNTVQLHLPQQSSSNEIIPEKSLCSSQNSLPRSLPANTGTISKKNESLNKNLKYSARSTSADNKEARLKEGHIHKKELKEVGHRPQDASVELDIPQQSSSYDKVAKNSACSPQHIMPNNLPGDSLIIKDVPSGFQVQELTSFRSNDSGIRTLSSCPPVTTDFQVPLNTNSQQEHHVCNKPLQNPVSYEVERLVKTPSHQTGTTQVITSANTAETISNTEDSLPYVATDDSSNKPANTLPTVDISGPGGKESTHVSDAVAGSKSGGSLPKFGTAETGSNALDDLSDFDISTEGSGRNGSKARDDLPNSGTDTGQPGRDGSKTRNDEPILKSCTAELGYKTDSNVYVTKAMNVFINCKVGRSFSDDDDDASSDEDNDKVPLNNSHNDAAENDVNDTVSPDNDNDEQWPILKLLSQLCRSCCMCCHYIPQNN